MNLTHLKFFYDAVIYKSVSESARRNFRTQSAISQGITALEQSLGVKLTTHQKQRLKLTEEGTIVFNHAKTIFGCVKELQEELYETQETLRGEVKFVTTNAIALSQIPLAYLTMKQLHPEVTVSFHRGNLAFIREALRLGTADFAIAVDSPEFDHFDHYPLYKGTFQLYHSEKLSHPNIDEGILIDHHTNDEVVKFKRKYKRKYRKELNIQLELSGWGMVHQFVRNGIGIGYLPDFIADKELNTYPIELTPQKYKIVAVFSKGAKPTRSARALMECFTQKCCPN